MVTCLRQQSTQQDADDRPGPWGSTDLADTLRQVILVRPGR